MLARLNRIVVRAVRGSRRSIRTAGRHDYAALRKFNAILGEGLLHAAQHLAPHDELFSGNGHEFQPHHQTEKIHVINALKLQWLKDRRTELFLACDGGRHLFDDLLHLQDIGVQRQLKLELNDMTLIARDAFAGRPEAAEIAAFSVDNARFSIIDTEITPAPPTVRTNSVFVSRVSAFVRLSSSRSPKKYSAAASTKTAITNMIQ